MILVTIASSSLIQKNALSISKNLIFNLFTDILQEILITSPYGAVEK